MDKLNPPTRFGVFAPVGHIVASFPDAATMLGARMALLGRGIEEARICVYTDGEMEQQAQADIARASPVASIGQELNLVRAHLELAALGYHFMVIECADDDDAQAIAETLRHHDVERAQHYGTFIIEELVEHADDAPQVAESPDRGLDAQTWSGTEAERALRTPRVL